jgi:hypothetical protein
VKHYPLFHNILSEVELVVVPTFELHCLLSQNSDVSSAILY